MDPHEEHKEAQRPLAMGEKEANASEHRFKKGSPTKSTLWTLVIVILLSAAFLQYVWPSGLIQMLGLLACTPHLQDAAAETKTGSSWAGDAAGKGKTGDQYLIGVGKADITSPVVEINLMGYADPNQVGSGLRQRLYSRAFMVGDVANPSDRFVYLVLDIQSGDTAVRYGILSRLRDLGKEYEVYGQHNIAVTGTHSHSGPGGWLNYLLPQITSKGFDKQGFQAIVDGAVLSIRRAHESLSRGYLTIGTTKVEGANINRSLFAYLANPESERARYNASAEDDGSVEKEMTLLKFQRASDRRNIGVLTWFPTHGTSMLGNNTLVSGDNKGVAAYLFERSAAGQDGNDGGGFVAGFSQASVGDTSPNVLGAWCEDGTGQMCSFENSTCSDGRSQQCHGRGPFFGRDDGGAASCFEIGRRQFEAARRVYDQLNKAEEGSSTDDDDDGEAAMVRVRGGWVKSFHAFHNMSDFAFTHPNGSTVRTCPAALGYSFAAGTSDGPGAFDFTQHDGDPSNTSPVWRAVSHLLKEPSEGQVACQHPKPILLDVGEVHRPYQWTPNVVDIQVFRAGQLVIIVSPGEATTMAGRRWKDAAGSAYAALFDQEDALRSSSSASPASPSPPIVVLGGPSNTYTHYITTEEEYSIQRYEGASTLYGPHTLAAYINVTLSLLPYLSAQSRRGDGDTPPHHTPGTTSSPPDNSNRSLSFITGVVRDAPPAFRSFGDVLVQPDALLYGVRTSPSVRAVFVAANPRNDLRLGRTYAAVERLGVFGEGGGGRGDSSSSSSGGGPRWRTVRDDADWSLVFRWTRTSTLLATSEAEVVWEVEDWAEPGVYRLRYFGDSKSLGGEVTPFSGTSEVFTLR